MTSVTPPEKSAEKALLTKELKLREKQMEEEIRDLTQQLEDVSNRLVSERKRAVVAIRELDQAASNNDEKKEAQTKKLNKF